MITLEMKKEIIEKRDRGVSVIYICLMYRKSSSTTCTILKQKDKILVVSPSKGVTWIIKNRPPIIDDVEKLLLVWINENQMQGDTINDLLEKTPRMSTDEDTSFKASKGWFEKFKTRTAIHSVVRHGEAASSNTMTANDYP